MQETWVPSLIQEDAAEHRSLWATAIEPVLQSLEITSTEPMCCSCWSLSALEHVLHSKRSLHNEKPALHFGQPSSLLSNCVCVILIATYLPQGPKSFSPCFPSADVLASSFLEMSNKIIIAAIIYAAATALGWYSMYPSSESCVSVTLFCRWWNQSLKRPCFFETVACALQITVQAFDPRTAHLQDELLVLRSSSLKICLCLDPWVLEEEKFFRPKASSSILILISSFLSAPHFSGSAPSPLMWLSPSSLQRQAVCLASPTHSGVICLLCFFVNLSIWPPFLLLHEFLGLSCHLFHEPSLAPFLAPSYFLLDGQPGLSPPLLFLCLGQCPE